MRSEGAHDKPDIVWLQQTWQKLEPSGDVLLGKSGADEFVNETPAREQEE
jgi:hypothetical protein